MNGSQKIRQKMNLVTLLFGIGLLPPLLILANKPVLIKGFPLLFTYIFIGWGLMIFVMALLTQKTDN
jgi:hypothetical protein